MQLMVNNNITDSANPWYDSRNMYVSEILARNGAIGYLSYTDASDISYLLYADSLLLELYASQVTTLCSYSNKSTRMHYTRLRKLDIPNCQSISDRALSDLSQLTDITTSQVTYIGTSAFTGCRNLRELYLPRLSSLSGSCFTGCINLSTMIFSDISYIKAYALKSCGVSILYFGGSSVPTLATYSALYNSYFTSGNCAIYVPSSLYSQYISATNWATYSSYIHSGSFIN